MDNIKPIEDMIDAGLGQRAQQVFNSPLLFSNAPDRKKMQAERQRQNARSTEPFLFAALTGIALAETRYSPQTLMRRGLYGSASHDMVQTYHLRMVPVTKTFQISFVCKDLDTAHDFAKRWMFVCIEKSLNFSITYGVASIDIAVDMDRDVSIPMRSGGIEEAPEFEVTTNLRVEGYMSKPLEMAQAATEVRVEGVLLPLGADRTRGESTTQVFEFNRPWDN